MDYSQLSDSEIAQKVWFWSNQNIEHDNTICSMSGGKMLYVKNSVWTAFDPCHNPADAWQIIVDNEISLNSYSGTWEASYEYDASIGAFGTDELVTKAVEGKNPLRTAMIAFLMKREHSNA